MCLLAAARPRGAVREGWLLDTDVICQPAKRPGDPQVVAWLGQERDHRYTNAVVIA